MKILINMDESADNVLLKAGFPPLYIKTTEQHPRFDELYEKIKVKKSLYITGKVGVGKTQLAVDLVREYISKKTLYGIPMFHNATRLLTTLRSSYGTFNTHEVYKQIRKAEILIIDDLGVEKSTEWINEALYMLINDRYETMRQTIVTTNLTIKEISTLFNDRIASRIVEMCEYVELTGVDRRFKNSSFKL